MSGDIVYIKKTLAAWEVKTGAISISGDNLINARTLFQNYLNMSFSLLTFKGNYANRRFVDGGYKLTLSCRQFFGKLKMGDVIYLRPLSDNTILISKTELLEQVKN